MINLRWRTGTGTEENERMLFRDNRCVGMVHSSALAIEIVNVLNGASKNDREYIAKIMVSEANRCFSTQEKDYPSNILDTVAANIRCGFDDFLLRGLKEDK